MEYPKWFFMWKTGTPYITNICGWSKEQVIEKVETDTFQTWKQIYSQGGRIVKVKISICKNNKKKISKKLTRKEK